MVQAAWSYYDSVAISFVIEIGMDPATSTLLIHDFIDLPRAAGEGHRLLERLDLHRISSLNTHSAARRV